MLQYTKEVNHVMSLEQRDRFIQQIFTVVAPYVDSLSSGFSFWLDHLWRRRAVALSGIREGQKVLDVCSGTGELSFLLAQKVGPNGSVIGADFCNNMLALARKKAGGNWSNVSFIFSDAKKLPFPDQSFDAVTVSFGMRNIPDTQLALREICRVLRPGGAFVCLELTRPHSRWFLHLYQWYVFRVMPFIGKLVVKTSAPYLYLPRSINAFYQPSEFKTLIERSGFSDVCVNSFTMGVATLYRAAKYG
ncbi:MAG TPA: bifunctional demethylmenaquinone methyltransferase/2-methoxy-6-polyprenyl-1,4-benzoquinol methylase UbiE [Nitrospirota bacterium]|nr:bifunctional demethylmenaquinone methyltransferase/2-methoxy-6-polyprenyl-1,4-benzoquinol methylase UbiE [Nitrospirota bacterium]